MTTEYLLQAIGQIDDDLILDAQLPVKRPSPLPRRLLSWAAALLVCVGVSTLFLSWRTGSGGSTCAPAASAPTATAPVTPGVTGSLADTNTTENASPGAQAPSASPSMKDVYLQVILTVDAVEYSYFHRYEEDPTVDQLPDGCRSVGKVEKWSKGSSAPYTDYNVYIGCELWLLEDGEDRTLYLELPEGGYLVCRPS